MILTIENILLIGSILLFISIIASKSAKFGIPALILFLAIGMLAGSDGLGQIYFNDPEVAQSLGIIALTFILFSGGLETKWEHTKPIAWKGILLSTIGVLFTAIAVGVFVSWLSIFTLREGLLLGAIVSSTDAAAVFSILRSKNIGLKSGLKPLLEFESGSNDPMAYFLTIGFTSLLLEPEASFTVLIPLFFQQMVLGAAIGWLMGKAMVWIINKINLEYEGLYPVLVLAMVLFTYSAADFIQGNGFLAVYISAIILGNNNFIHKRSLILFYNGQAWLMQILMFITLGLFVFPQQIIPVIGIGLLISLFLIFIARPLGVFASLLFFKMKTRERLFISWVGLRGAVPIVFATYPLIAGVQKSEMIFNLVFFIVLTSVAIQGTTLSLVAKWLKLYTPEKFKPQYGSNLFDEIASELAEIEISPKALSVGKSIVELDFPKTSLIVLINRNDKYITPNGSTIIESGDKLHIMSDNKEELEKVIVHSLGMDLKES